ncbi:MAG: hypothetical protein ISS48_02475 [Candidatus Aenigmarchaeota archaeon]|nr:hypothetical protein [Candidatus Aenigmarchaeota archaeon]
MENRVKPKKLILRPDRRPGGQVVYGDSEVRKTLEKIRDCEGIDTGEVIR